MSKQNQLLACFVAAKFFLQFSLTSSFYELHRDEFLHLDQANHLAWGYTSVPPLTSWISLLIKQLGNSEMVVRFFPALFGAATMVIVWKTVEKLRGSTLALILAGSCLLFSVLLRLNILYQPNSLDVLLWTTFYYVLIGYLQTKHPRWLYLAALVFAAGMLNKYNFAFLLLGLFPALLLSRHRKVFVHKHFYGAAAFGIVLLLPNVWWQFQHGFPVIHHMKELSDTQLKYVDRWHFLREQFLFFLGGIPVLIAGLYGLRCYRPFRELRFFVFSFFFTLLIFLLLKGKSYYAIGLYPIYFAFGAVFIAYRIREKQTLAKLLLPILPPLSFIPMFLYAFPNRDADYIKVNKARYLSLGMLRWEDGKDHELPQDFADMLGWKELAAKTDSLVQTLPEEEAVLILCDNYGQAGAINYYGKSKQKAVSLNADYLYWFDFSKKYVHFIRIKQASEAATEMEKTAPYFEESRLAGTIKNTHAREFGTTLFLFRHSKINLNERLQQEVTAAQKRTH